MGNKQSKIRTPYEVLEIEPTATKDEIRSAYIKLMLIHHPTRQKKGDPQIAIDITNAYTTIKNSSPLFEYYTEELFKRDLMRYASDFFERVGDYCGLVSPNFMTEHKELYKIYSRFRLYKCSRKFRNEESKNLFCYNVSKITNIVRKLDDRVLKEKEATLEINKPVVTNIIADKEVNIKPYACEECKKSFKSKNQLINHYNSKKHYAVIEKFGGDAKLFIKNQIENIKDIPLREDTQENAEACEIIDIFNHLTIKKKYDSEEEPENESKYNPVNGKTKNDECDENKCTFIRSEPTVFRTCSKCRSVFKNRTELLKHIKGSHT